MIVSMAWLPSQRAQRLLRDVYGSTKDRCAFDILVVDEAHHVAPISPTRTDKLGITRRGYAIDSQRTHAVRELAERASTACSSARPRTTATPSRSPRCWR